MVNILVTATDRMETSNNIMGVITDSAEPNKLMATLFEKHGRKQWKHIKDEQTKPPTYFKANTGWLRCMCHAVNIATQKILTQLKVQSPKEREELYDDKTFDGADHFSAFSKMRRIIAKVRRSEPLKAALSRTCIAANTQYFKLQLDMEVRWNSTAVMLDTFLKLEQAINMLFAGKDAKENGIDHLLLVPEEWDYLARLHRVFQIFQPIIKKLSAQSYPPCVQRPSLLFTPEGTTGKLYSSIPRG